MWSQPPGKNKNVFKWNTDTESKIDSLSLEKLHEQKMLSRRLKQKYSLNVNFLDLTLWKD